MLRFLGGASTSWGSSDSSATSWALVAPRRAAGARVSAGREARAGWGGDVPVPLTLTWVASLAATTLVLAARDLAMLCGLVGGDKVVCEGGAEAEWAGG